MSIERRNFPQFFITASAPCPYLAGRMERKVFTHLIGNEAINLHDTLSQGGFRRSQNIAYRPACDNCTACVSVRMPVRRFAPTDSFKRVIRRNRDLVVETVPAQATGEHYSLFRDYILARHGDGGMSDMTVSDFAAMVDESFVDTSIIEYRLPARVSLAGSRRTGGRLVAASLTDRLDDGMSMIYSFFDPALSSRSLGSYMILDHIARAREAGLGYLYLGYWVEGSDKMDYKARFLPQERLLRDGWTLIEA